MLQVTSDLLFLLELVATANASHGGDAGEMIPASAHTCRLVSLIILMINGPFVFV